MIIHTKSISIAAADNDEGGDGAKDACQGDSGGPLVVKVQFG